MIQEVLNSYSLLLALLRRMVEDLSRGHPGNLGQNAFSAGRLLGPLLPV